MSASMLDTRTAIDAIGRMSLTRLARSKALWISAALAMLPVLGAILISGSSKSAATNWTMVHLTLRLTIVLIPPLVVGASLADDIGEKSSAYLWSRALPRWVIVAAKIIYLVPVIFGLAAVSATLAWLIAHDAAGVDAADLARTLVGIAATTIAASALTMMAVVLAPRFGVVIALCWLLTLDVALGGRAMGARVIATSFSIAAFAEDRDVVVALVSAAVIAAGCLAVALKRIDRIE